MNKKELIAPFLIVALSLLFGAICFMVFLSNGRSKKWVARKMLIGGLLLSLTSVVQTGCHRNTLCYKFADVIPKIEDAKLNLRKTKSHIITGSLWEIEPIYYDQKGFERWKRENYDSSMINEEYKKHMSISSIKEAGPPSFYYEIINPDNQQIINYGNIIPSDGKFESTSKENFEIHFEQKLKKGKYIFKIYYRNLFSVGIFNYPNPMKIEIDSKNINIRR